jgi:hypothetical protein
MCPTRYRMRPGTKITHGPVPTIGSPLVSRNPGPEMVSDFETPESRFAKVALSLPPVSAVKPHP